jgi:hypothetical protein
METRSLRFTMRSDQSRHRRSPLARPVPAHEPVLSASQIASFTFCPQAWHLSRRNVVQNDGGVERLLEGVCAHRGIGTRTDRLRAIELACGVLIIVLCGLAAIVLTQLISSGTLRLP